MQVQNTPIEQIVSFFLRKIKLEKKSQQGYIKRKIGLIVISERSKIEH